MTVGLPLRAAGPNLSGQTNFVQGALGAGGYASGLAMAPDGSTMMLRNDTALPWQWSRSTNRWANVAKQTGMTTIVSDTPWEFAYAPSNSSIIYLCYPTGTNIDGSGGGRAVSRGYIWRSTDGGASWTQRSATGVVGISGGNPPSPSNNIKYGGPRMAVDPNNSDVIYIISATGTCYVSYDGGTTLTVISQLLAALPSSTVLRANIGGQHDFDIAAPNPIIDIGANFYYCYDSTWPLALGSNGDGDDGITNTGTQFTGSISGTTLTVSALTTLTVITLPTLIQAHSGSGITANTNITAQIILGTVANLAALPGSPSFGDTYFVTDHQTYFIWNGSSWVSPANGFQGLNNIGQYTVSVSQTFASAVIDSCTLHVGQLQDRTGGSGTTSIAVGDTVYFGRGGSVAIDGSSGTIANPGGSGVISNTVYFSWQIGASNIWRTTNGGGSWAAMSGGPSTVGGKMKMSFDANLGKAHNVLYVCDGSTLWRYVETAPTGSGLSATTWTSTTGLPLSVAPSPYTFGKLISLNINGSTEISTDYGSNWTAGNTASVNIVSGPTGIPPNGTDTPWLTEVTDFFSADCEYDRVTDGKLWTTLGVGMFYQQPSAVLTPTITAITKDATGAVVTVTGNDWFVGESFLVSGATGMTNPNGVRFYIQAIPPTGGLTAGQLKTNVDSSAYTGTYNAGSGTASKYWQFTSQSDGMDSMTLQKVIKCPAPNGRIIVSCQDRQIFAMPNVSTYPTSYWPNLGSGVANSMDITYSKSDPTCVWASLAGTLQRTTDGGVTQGSTVLNVGWSMIASTTPSSCVNVPIGALIQYTADGGSTWNNSLFAGSTLGGASTGPFQPCQFWMVCDDFGNYYYWDHNTAKFWKSTDGGTNFTLQSTTAFNPGGGDGGTILCTPGVLNDVWYAPGGFLSFNFVVIAYRSTDGGATWSACNQSGDLTNVNQMAFGATKPGNSYPTLYAIGNPAPTFDVNQYGMFRCDNPNSGSRIWTPINNYYKVNPEGARYLFADLETYGTVYKAQDSTGYVVGSLG